MSILAVLLAAGLLLAGGFLAGFVWAVRSGQFDDTTTPAVRLLLDAEGEPASSPGPNRTMEEPRMSQEQST